MAKASKMNGSATVSKNKKQDIAIWEGHYGTKNEMVIKELENGQIVAQDGNGHYLTSKTWVGNNLLDPNRVYNRQVVEISTNEDVV